MPLRNAIPMPPDPRAIKLCRALEDAIGEALATGLPPGVIYTVIGNMLGYAAANRAPDVATVNRSLQLVFAAAMEAAADVTSQQRGFDMAGQPGRA